MKRRKQAMLRCNYIRKDTKKLLIGQLHPSTHSLNHPPYLMPSQVFSIIRYIDTFYQKAVTYHQYNDDDIIGKPIDVFYPGLPCYLF